MQKEEWDAEKTGAGRRRTSGRRSTRPRRCGRAPRATSPTRSTRSSTSRSASTAEPPLAYTHNRVEGRSEYTQLLYIPAKAPFDLWNRDKRGGVKLYVKRVFIMDDAEALMPVYLRFVKGVIDSSRPAAQRQPRAAAGKPRREGDPRGLRPSACCRCSKSLADSESAEKDKYAALLEGVRRGAEGRRRRGPRQPRAAGQAAALRVDARRRGRVLRRLRRRA